MAGELTAGADAPVRRGGATASSSASRAGADGLARTVAFVDRNWRWFLGGLMCADVALLLYMGRGLTFFYDDWDYVIHDYGGGIHSLLTPHNGHLSIIPIAIYKVLFHLVGLNHYAVFRLVLIGLHLMCAGLVFVLAARRVSRVPALLAAALILFLGVAWEDLLWAFQMDYLLSIAAGLLALVLLERTDRRGEVGVMLCLIVALGSSGLGIPVVIAVAAEMAWLRRWRSAWVVIVPVLLFALWYLSYGESEITEVGLINSPGFSEDLMAAAFGAVIGRSLEWGRPLALLGCLILLRQMVRTTPVSSRLVGLLAMGISLWIIMAVARSTISAPETGRYVYFGAVVIVLVGAELARGIVLAPRLVAVIAVLVLISAITGLTSLHSGSVGLRGNSEAVAAELGALELAASHAPARYQPDAQRAPQIEAGPYLHTVRAIHSSPADSPSAILAADPASRAAADGVLLTLYAPVLEPLRAAGAQAAGSPPAVSSLSGATELGRGTCTTIAPLAGATATANVELPPGAVVIRDEGSSPASVALRRFGESFDPLSTGAAPHSAALLSMPRDSASVPWQMQVVSSSQLSLCGAGSGS
jgi:hypothetical protein